MAYDAEVVVRQGSIRPLYAEAIATHGAGTAIVQPGAAFTLYRED